ncbi:hypothetical protein [Streptomyces sp. NPDC046862]|uniref:hypothetical protein n=1 Tax=Streptomyces sp. NPDC046862 TaxID=3154603 RepID=UPI0034564BA7
MTPTTAAPATTAAHTRRRSGRPAAGADGTPAGGQEGPDGQGAGGGEGGRGPEGGWEAEGCGGLPDGS